MTAIQAGSVTRSMKQRDSNRGAPLSGAEPPLSPAELRAVSDEISNAFPAAEGAVGVVLMDVDPHRIYAYWNLEPEVLERMLAEFSAGGQQAHLVLRFHALADEDPDSPGGGIPLEAFDRELEGAVGQLELQVRGDGGRYEAELGLTAEDGGWRSLARSNRVHMPPPGPAAEPGRATLDLAAVDEPAPGESPAGNQPEPLPISPAPIAFLPMSADPSLRGGPPDQLEPVFPNQAPLPLEQKPRGGAGGRLEPEVSPAPQRHFEAAGLPDMAAASRLFSSAVLSSSGFSGSIDEGLEIRAELRVWGRTVSGRELTLLGLPIPMTADGEFDLRRELNPRELPLEIDGRPIKKLE